MVRLIVKLRVEIPLDTLCAATAIGLVTSQDEAGKSDD